MDAVLAPILSPVRGTTAAISLPQFRIPLVNVTRSVSVSLPMTSFVILFADSRLLTLGNVASISISPATAGISSATSPGPASASARGDDAKESAVVAIEEPGAIRNRGPEPRAALHSEEVIPPSQLRTNVARSDSPRPPLDPAVAHVDRQARPRGSAIALETLREDDFAETGNDAGANASLAITRPAAVAVENVAVSAIGVAAIDAALAAAPAVYDLMTEIMSVDLLSMEKGGGLQRAIGEVEAVGTQAVEVVTDVQLAAWLTAVAVSVAAVGGLHVILKRSVAPAVPAFGPRGLWGDVPPRPTPEDRP
jgi:hypothetical protein